MIEICKLTKRQVDPPTNKKLPKQLEHVKIFSLSVGHGVGTIDFVERIGEIEDEEYTAMLKQSDDYVNFKLGNLYKYFEIEIFPEHARKLTQRMPDCFLKGQLLLLKEGYIVIRKKI